MTTFETAVDQLPRDIEFNQRNEGQLKIYQKLISDPDGGDTYNYVFIDESKRDGATDAELLGDPRHPAVITFMRTEYYRLYLKAVYAIIDPQKVTTV